MEVKNIGKGEIMITDAHPFDRLHMNQGLKGRGMTTRILADIIRQYEKEGTEVRRITVPSPSKEGQTAYSRMGFMPNKDGILELDAKEFRRKWIG